MINSSMMTTSNGNIVRVTGHLCGESPVPVNSPHKCQWNEALVFSLIWAWINVWVKHREAGGLRRNRAHYDVNVMSRIYVSKYAITGSDNGLALLYGWSGANEVTLKYMDKIEVYPAVTNHKHAWIIYIFLGIYCTNAPGATLQNSANIPTTPPKQWED